MTKSSVKALFWFLLGAVHVASWWALLHAVLTFHGDLPTVWGFAVGLSALGIIVPFGLLLGWLLCVVAPKLSSLYDSLPDK